MCLVVVTPETGLILVIHGVFRPRAAQVLQQASCVGYGQGDALPVAWMPHTFAWRRTAQRAEEVTVRCRH